MIRCERCDNDYALTHIFTLTMRSPVSGEPSPPITLCVKCGHDVVEFIYPDLKGTGLWDSIRAMED